MKELLNQLSVLPGRVAVEVNLSVVKKADYPSFALKDGDVIEIVNFVGGGSSAILARREKGVRCLTAHVT